MHVIWCGFQAEIYGGPVDHSKIDLGEEFPWICDGDDGGLHVVVPIGDIDKNGIWDTIHAGVNFNDLITQFIQVESTFKSCEHEDAVRRRNQVINALKLAVNRLESEPFSFYD